MMTLESTVVSSFQSVFPMVSSFDVLIEIFITSLTFYSLDLFQLRESDSTVTLTKVGLCESSFLYLSYRACFIQYALDVSGEGWIVLTSEGRRFSTREGALFALPSLSS